MTLIAQLTDMHILEHGVLAYGQVYTAGFMSRAITHLNGLSTRPDLVVITGDLVECSELRPSSIPSARLLTV
jgi:3',5'-cyclic-AMP phosphodiesterase